MALIDTYAAGRLTELREAQGLSPEALAVAINLAATQKGLGQRGAVNAHTIRRIERHGHVPGVRVAFVITSYFGMLPHELWQPTNRRSQVPA